VLESRAAALALIPAFAAEESRWPLQAQASIAARSRTIALIPFAAAYDFYAFALLYRRNPHNCPPFDQLQSREYTTKLRRLNLPALGASSITHHSNQHIVLPASGDGVDHNQRNAAAARASATTTARRRRSRTAMDIHR
jgi:hypothetical protein